MPNTERKPTEFDPAPGKPTSDADVAALALRRAARSAGEPVPPVARAYNGWDKGR